MGQNIVTMSNTEIWVIGQSNNVSAIVFVPSLALPTYKIELLETTEIKRPISFYAGHLTHCSAMLLIFQSYIIYLKHRQ